MKQYSKEKLITYLKSLNKQYVSQSYIDSCPNTPCSSTFKRYFGSWKSALISAGLNTGIITGRPQDEEIIIPNNAMEIIEGELLGDGCMSLTGSYKSNACFSHSTANIEYGKYLYNKLNLLGVKLLSPEILPPRNKGRAQFRTRTTSNVAWTNLYHKWYINSKKTIPLDLILNKERCLHWYLGDGHFSKSGIIIYTCGFKKHEVIFLSNQLSNFGAYCKKNKKYYIIYIPKKYKKMFLEYIGSCPVDGYEHRWGQ